MLQSSKNFCNLKLVAMLLAGLLIFQTANAAGVILLNATAYSYDPIPDYSYTDFTLQYLYRNFTAPTGIFIDNNSNSTWRYFFFQMSQNSTIRTAGYNWINRNSPNVSIETVAMGPHAYSIKILNSKVNELISQNFTRWLGVLPPEFKMDGILLNLLYTEPNQIINVSITLFDYNDNATLEHIKKFNKTPLIMYGTYYFALNVSDARELATPENIRELYRDMRNEGPATTQGDSGNLGVFGYSADYFAYNGNYPGYNYLPSSEKAVENNTSSINNAAVINNTAPTGNNTQEERSNGDFSIFYVLIAVIVILAVVLIVVRGIV